MLTMRRTVAEGVRMCTGLAAPSRIGPMRDAVAGGRLEQVVGDVGGVEVGHDQQVGLALQARVGKRAVRRPRRQRGVAVHLAVHFELGRPLAISASASRIFCADGRVAGCRSSSATAAPTFGVMPKRRHFLGGHQRDLGELLGAWDRVDVGVADEQLCARAASARSSPRRSFTPGAHADHLVDVAQVAGACVPKVPQSMPSASPLCISIAPISVRRRRISILAYCCVTPLRSRQAVVVCQ